MPEPGGTRQDLSALVLHQRRAERRVKRNPGMDPRTDRLRLDQRRQRCDAQLGRQPAHRHSPQERRPARRRAVALRQRRDLHDVPELGERRRLQQLDQHGRRLPAVLPRRVPVPRSHRRLSALELPLARDALSLSVIAATPALWRHSRSQRPTRPRLQRPGHRQAAVSEELQLERLHASLRLLVLLRLDRERPDDVAPALRVLRLRRLRDQQPHARRKPLLHRPA